MNNQHFSYLQFDAEVIARIRVEDDLTEENSIILYCDNYENSLIGFYSKREVSVLEYYKTNIPIVRINRKLEEKSGKIFNKNFIIVFRVMFI